MGLNDFDRNYGATSNSREYWGGNNGFVTVVLNLGADVELGVTKVAQDGSEEAFVADNAAQKNLAKVVQTLATRGVLVTTSVIGDDADASKAGFDKVGGNVLAFAKVGTPAAGAYAVTFVVERADVFTKQENKPGATYALTVEPAADMAATLATAGLFIKKDGSVADAATAVVVKVYDALPPILS